METRATIETAILAIRPPDTAARNQALALQSRLKPGGSLGRLKEFAVWAAGMAREPGMALHLRAAGAVPIDAIADHRQ